MNYLFSEQILADKLSKLNSTQQCIETLSHWCIFHRSEAELVVTTWEKQFKKSEMIQKVPLLYLANDILQNSKRKGNEFVTEFLKVLPGAVKDVVQKGDDHGKTVVSRLVDIWEERGVFGSCTKSLNDVMLGEDGPRPLEFNINRKRSRSVKIVKRDLRSIRTKLTIGGSAEKIVSAFHVVLSEHPNEDAEMTKCKSAVHRIRKMERGVDLACTTAKDPNRKILAEELEDNECILKQCIEKLKSVEENRVALVSQLREALHEQESELESVRTQMQVAQAQTEEASHMRKQLTDDSYIFKPSTATSPHTDANATNGQTSKITAATIAAEVADKLTASSSSQMIMTSVLSTFAAEEAKNAAMKKSSEVSNSFTSMPANSVSGSMAKSENPVPISDPNFFMQSQALNAQPNHSYQSVLVPQQTMPNQTPTTQTQYHMLPNSPQQYMQLSGMMMTPYGYATIPSLLPGRPPPPLANPMVPLMQQPLQIHQRQQMPLAQQPPGPFSFRPLQSPGMVYYGQVHPQ